MDVQLVSFVGRWEDYVRKVSLRVDRGRIDKKCHVHVGFPFWTYACKTEVRVMAGAGGLRADSLRGHRRHIQLFFSTFDFTHTRDFERRRT